MNIYVGNLNYKVNEDDLRNMFEEYGKVGSAKIITDKYNGRSKGFGFVEMEDENHAGQAIEALNGTAYKERDLVVNEARPKLNYNN